MAPDNVTTLSTLEAEEKKTEPDNVEEVNTTKEEQKTSDDDIEKITTERELKVEENLSEKMEDQKDNEKKEIVEAVAEIIEKNVEELVEKEAVPNVDKRKQDEPYVIEETKDNDSIVCETQPVLVDEIDMKKEVEIKEKEEEKSKVGCVKEIAEPLKIEKNAMGVEKDKEAAENEKQETMEAVEIKENTMGTGETKENGGTHEPSTIGTKDPEDHAPEQAKTESKEEKTVDETKLTDSSGKEEVKSSPKQSNNLMGKVKKSFMKAKKAISWKHNSNTKNNETKEDEKA